MFQYNIYNGQSLSTHYSQIMWKVGPLYKKNRPSIIIIPECARIYINNLLILTMKLKI